MPNLCFIDYRITGSGEDLVRLNATLKAIDRENNPEPSARQQKKLFLRQLITALGGSLSAPEGDGGIVDGGIDCDGRGYVEDFTLNLKTADIFLQTVTAWNEEASLRPFLKSVFPSLKFYYWQDYEGEIFTNDVEGRFFPERYVLNGDLDGTDWEAFREDEKDRLLELFNRTTGMDAESVDAIDGLIEVWEDEHPDEYIEFVRVEVCND